MRVRNLSEQTDAASARMIPVPARFFLVVLVVSGCAAMKPAAGPVEAVERARFVAMTRQDIAALEPVLAADLTYCHSNGQCEDKTQFLKTIETGRVRYKDIRVEQLRSRAAGQETAIVNGAMRIDGEQAGQPIALHINFTDVYVNRDGRWQLVAWQSTRLP
jgi:hypothetical protein